MFRIGLPVLYAAAYFFPWNKYPNVHSMTDRAMTGDTGWSFVKPSVDCLMDKTFSVVGACAPEHGLLGYVMLAAFLVAAAAAAIAVIAVMPALRSLSSLLNISCGVCGLASVGLLASQVLSDEVYQFGLGAYGAAAAAVLLVIFGAVSGREE